MGFGQLVGIPVALLAILAGVVYQTVPLLQISLGHKLEPYKNTACSVIPDAQACEKIVLHEGSGLLYMACSTPESRLNWAPYFMHFNNPSPTTDYVAFYDPSSGKTKRLSLGKFPDAARGIHVHGMDVVQSRVDPTVLYVYLVNHRPQPNPGDEAKLGTDSVIELFKTSPGSSSLTHVKTFRDPEIIRTPNDVSGSPDGDSFFFTNDSPGRLDSFARNLQLFFNTATTSVGYCDLENGCKIAASKVRGANGIVRLDDDTIYVAGFYSGTVGVYARQSDNTLVLTDEIATGQPVDNLTADSEGNVYATGVLQLFNTLKHFKDPQIKNPYRVMKISLNTGRDAYFGTKYVVTKIFEDDGNQSSGATVAAYDPKNKRLYVGGAKCIFCLRLRDN